MACDPNYIDPDNKKSIYPDLDSLSLPSPNNQATNQCKKLKSGISHINELNRDHSLSSNSTISTNSTVSNKSIPKSTKRMIIFDWDDTLFPSTYFVNNSRRMSITELNIWGCRVYKLLKTYIDVFGAKNIYIITNAINGWIEDSLQMASKQFQSLLLTQFNNIRIDLNDPFMAIHGLLDINNIKLISARSLFIDQFPDFNDSEKWKELTFIHYAIHHFWSDNNGVIISIGDYWDEWYASKNCTKFLNNLDKTSKFNLQRIKCKDEPTLNELIKEWDTLILIADHLKLKNTSFDQCDLYLVSLILESEFDKKMKEISNSNSDTKLTKKANIRENAVTFI